MTTNSGTIKIIKILIVGIIAILIMPLVSLADQDTEDVFASVVILPTFDIVIDNNYLDFGIVEPGQSATLKEGTYYNQARCISNKGIEYFVKIDLLDDIIGPNGTKIPPQSLKWKVYRSTGTGTAVSGWQEFSKDPVLVYTSSSDDAMGADVNIKFQYRLDLPYDALGGNYNLRVAYIITEEK